jgi:hypothetical protein
MAPAKLAVEISWSRGGNRRAFRLSRAIDPEHLFFERALPFPAGEPADVRFSLPGEDAVIAATVELGTADARFLAIAADDRARITAYFKERLALP